MPNGQGQCFVGHIGGDDFIVVLPPEWEEKFALSFIAEFDRIIPTYYNEEDQKQGMIRVTNRRGKLDTFPLMSCSVAACNNLHRSYKSLGEIAQDAAELKTFLKGQPGSRYLRDRRSSPVGNLEEAEALLKASAPKKEPSAEDIPLGQLLLEAGLVDQESLSLALKKHLETGRRLGETLIAMNLVSREDVGRILEKKYGAPYISLEQTVISRDLLRLFTYDFMKTNEVVPVEMTPEGLKLGMCDPRDERPLRAIERLSALKVIPCLILKDTFDEFLESHSKEEWRKTGIG